MTSNGTTTKSEKRALWAVAALFFVNGVVTGSYVPRLPEIRDQIEIGTNALGGLLSIALLYLAFRGILPQIEYGLEAFLGNVAPRFLGLGEAAAVVLGGALLGLLGSIAALIGWRR